MKRSEKESEPSDAIYCLLDDEKTREKDRVIQWRQPRAAALKTSTRPSRKSPDLGLVDIGEKRNWLYSPSLHPDPEALEAQIAALAG